MLRKVVKYTNLNGVEVEKELLFDFSETEILEMEMSTEGGLSELIKQMTAAQDMTKIFPMYKKMILDAYGEKSANGEYFEKSPEIRNRFEHSIAFNTLFMELATSAEESANFFNGITPNIEALKKKMDKSDNK